MPGNPTDYYEHGRHGIKNMTKDMTKGKPLPILIRFAIPVFLGMLFQQFYNVTDTAIVGHLLGSHALAAVGTTGSLNFLILGFVIGITNGFCIPVARQFGAGDVKEMRRFAANAVYLCAFFAVILTTFTMLFTRNMLRMIDVPDDIIDISYSYIILIFAGIPVAMAYNLLACLLRALGNSKSPLYFLGVASVVNIALDLLFIVVWGLGVRGAGIATVLSQAVAATLCYMHIRKNFPVLQFAKEDLRYSFGHIKKLFAAGVPMGLQFSITAVGILILQRAVNGLGTVYIASMTSGNRVAMIFFQPMEALGLTMATYCGQNLGAKKLGRIKRGIRLALAIQFVYCICAGLILFFFGRYLAMMFIKPEETEILNNVQFLLRVSGSFFVSIGVLLVMRNSLQGLGYSVLAMSAGVSELVVRATVAFTLVGRFGFRGAVFASPLSWVLADIVLVISYFVVMRGIKAKLKMQK
ncbi:MAG: MATE family efflux transporter [Oscillospiraceae bacterium]|nr:MATE family efflux transporter [Oscillospiraceae bacterium]